MGKDSGETVSRDTDWLVAILEENNVEPLDGIGFRLAEVLSWFALDVQKRARQDMENADDMLDRTSIVAALRPDRFCGYCGDFMECAKHGAYASQL